MSNANVIWGSLNADSNLRKSVKMAKNLVSDQNRKYVSTVYEKEPYEKNICFFKKYILFQKTYILFQKTYILFLKTYILFQKTYVLLNV